MSLFLLFIFCLCDKSRALVNSGLPRTRKMLKQAKPILFLFQDIRFWHDSFRRIFQIAFAVTRSLLLHSVVLLKQLGTIRLKRTVLYHFFSKLNSLFLLFLFISTDFAFSTQSSLIQTTPFAGTPSVE